MKMRSFDYAHPTEIQFGAGRLAGVGDAVRPLGSRCLLVTSSAQGRMGDISERVVASLRGADIEVGHFDGVTSDPTTECITAGAEAASEFGAEVVLGVGGGSSMDAAKAIAVEATHDGSAWGYRWCSEDQPTDRTLPVVAVPTTAGTGSEVTQVAVLTKSEDHDKSAIYNSQVFPKVGIVDPELTVTMPDDVTAQSGFDAFAHAFESYLHKNSSALTDDLALAAMKRIINHLPRAVADGGDLLSRAEMAYASMVAGLCIANAGVTLPHGVAMTIGGRTPHVAHGRALAIVYPEFMRYTVPAAPGRFATVARLFDPSLEDKADGIAAESLCDLVDEFLRQIGLWVGFDDVGVDVEEIDWIADRSQTLPDYENNPKVASIEEIRSMLHRSRVR